MTTPAASELPESIQVIVDAIGLAAALKLVTEYGGISFYVPQEIPPGHVLEHLLGREAATALAAAYQGEDLQIPRCLSYLVDRRNHNIREQYASGVSAARLARLYGITERWVRCIVAGWSNDDDRQGALFPLK
ncbi:MAG: Mor transcription activator family protein [Deltaproteobacteria bacterium]|nr:Mor transcription activator family protein [Deltaproteobacteria bacterium]